MTDAGAQRGRMTVAIIGSGAAGAVTAYRLRQLLGAEARLLVFEREARVGGRAHNVEFAGARVEVGGTLIHSTNRRLGDLMAELGLERATPDIAMDGSAETLALWDGSRVVFRSRTGTAPLAWALVRRYGLRNVLRLRARTVAALRAFTQVYDLQDAGRVFSTPRELLDAIELGDATQLSTASALTGAGVSGPLITGLVEGILRNMYNQDAAINALAGSIALIGGGFAGGSVYSVGGGNPLLFERAIAVADAELHLGRAVAKVSASEGRCAVADAEGRVEAADAVVIAAPLEGASLALDGVGPDLRSRRYQTVHTTLVAGELSSGYLGLSTVQLPSHVLTTAGGNSPFKSIGVTGQSPEHGCRIYKIFSGDALSDGALGELFSTVRDVRRLVWQAYPILDPVAVWPDFELAPRIFYVNAFESAVSTLETEAVAAWNVAALVARAVS